MSEEEQLDTYCTRCGKAYNVATSNAKCDYLYCSKECEDADSKEL